MIKKLASHLGEYKRAAILTPMFSALEAVMDILLPTIMAFIIDLGIEKGDMNAIVKYGLLTFAVAAIALLLGVLAGKYAAEASTGFAGNLRDAMYENIQHYSFSNIDKFSTAGLVTRMTTDVTNLQNAFQMMERMCVRAPVHLVFALIMAFSIGGPPAPGVPAGVSHWRCHAAAAPVVPGSPGYRRPLPLYIPTSSHPFAY